MQIWCTEISLLKQPEKWKVWSYSDFWQDAATNHIEFDLNLWRKSILIISTNIYTKNSSARFYCAPSVIPEKLSCVIHCSNRVVDGQMRHLTTITNMMLEFIFRLVLAIWAIIIVKSLTKIAHFRHSSFAAIGSILHLFRPKRKLFQPFF